MFTLPGMWARQDRDTKDTAQGRGSCRGLLPGGRNPLTSVGRGNTGWCLQGQPPAQRDSLSQPSMGRNKLLMVRLLPHIQDLSGPQQPRWTLRLCLVIQHHGKYMLSERQSYDRHTTVIRCIMMIYVIYTMAI